MKELVFKILKKALKKKGLKLKDAEIMNLIEIPPSPQMGDYAFPCFSISDLLGVDSHNAAMEIREAIGSNYPETDFADIETKGPYVNFFVNRGSLARQVVWDIINQKKNYGRVNIGGGKRILVEFSSPNIAKPFGIGHLRSTIIGNSLANLLEFENFKVTRLNYLGDWGTQFGKLLFGYEKFGSEKKLEENPMKYLYSLYVKANKEQYEEHAREWFKKLENRDKKALMLWKLFRGFSLEDLKKFYKTLGIKFDAYESESDYNKKAKQILQDLKDKGLLKKSKGAEVVDLKKEGLGVAIMEKSDGTTIYAARDLAAAISRYKKYKFFKMIYEVGQEQKLHFNQFFTILKLMGYKWAEDCIHVYHGLYLGPKGKKFSTRKGQTVFMKDVFDEAEKLAKKGIMKRDGKISKKDLDERAKKIATAAIFYGDLKNNRHKDIVFDIKKFVSFEGDTGPYLLYSYARASSILQKSEVKRKFEVNELEDSEVELVKKLSKFPEVVMNAYKNLNPSVIANYAYQLAQTFNEFYHACPVIDSGEQETFRMALTESFRQVLRNALHLLGIETIEKM